MRKSRPYWRPAALAFSFALALPETDSGAACLSAEESREAVASGQAMTLSQALARAQISGTPVKVALCNAGAGYVYELAVRDSDGTLRTMRIPAS